MWILITWCVIGYFISIWAVGASFRGGFKEIIWGNLIFALVVSFALCLIWPLAVLFSLSIRDDGPFDKKVFKR
jgi:hypothetical protein